jgi:hypothetical protein
MWFGSLATSQLLLTQHRLLEGYIERATTHNMGYKNINALTAAQKKTGLSKFLSPKMIQWVLNLVEELDAMQEGNCQ